MFSSKNNSLLWGKLEIAFPVYILREEEKNQDQKCQL
jgi:hypothetical protein